MEEAIFVSRVENLKYVKSNYKRIYFGNEFCQWLIPSLDDLKAVIDFTLKNNLQFSFVSPYVTNNGLQTLMPILEYIKEQLSEAEIVINDWGVLRLARKELCLSHLVLGRLLTKQKRGPRILYLKDRVPKEMMQHFMASNVDVSILVDFLNDYGIKRVELDNLLQGMLRDTSSLKASLYFPFVYVTTTRYCLTASCENGRKPLRSIPTCRKECQKYTFKLQHKNMPVDLFLKGNTQFFKNEALPEGLEQLKIDRLVYEPEPPL